MSYICKGFWEEVAFKMFLERWIGFPGLVKAEMPTCSGQQQGHATGQGRTRCPGAVGEERKRKALVRLLWGRGSQWQLPADLSLSSAASPTAPPWLCV